MKTENEALVVEIEKDKIRIDQIKADLVYGPSTVGKIKYAKYLNGEVISRSSAIKAMCCKCRANYIDGLKDCKDATCPLYLFMPYGIFEKRLKHKRNVRRELKRSKNVCTS